MKEEELKAVEEMIAALKKEDPMGPAWNIMDALAIEIRKLKPLAASYRIQNQEMAYLIEDHSRLEDENEKLIKVALAARGYTSKEYYYSDSFWDLINYLPEVSYLLDKK